MPLRHSHSSGQATVRPSAPGQDQPTRIEFESPLKKREFATHRENLRQGSADEPFNWENSGKM